MQLFSKICRIFLFLLFCIASRIVFCLSIITNGHGGGIGDSLGIYCLAKALSLKHNLTFYFLPFEGSEYFKLYDLEKKISIRPPYEIIYNENMIVDYKEKNQVLLINCLTDCGNLSDEILKNIACYVQLKNPPINVVKHFPKDRLIVAIHIRTGMGSEHYDGDLFSQQYFSFDYSIIKYHEQWNHPAFVHFKNIGLDPFVQNKIFADVLYNSLRFPPEQYYLDQLLKLLNIVEPKRIFIQLFTDYPAPLQLLERIKSKVRKSDIEYCYHSYEGLSYGQRLINDLYCMSKCDVLIRSYSYFARAAEIMGDHKIVMFPLRYKWDENKLIITDIGVKGEFSQLHSYNKEAI